MIPLLLLALLAAAPDGGTNSTNAPLNNVPLLSPPLGRIGDAVTDPPPGGVPGGETTATLKLPHCDRTQTFWVSRYVMGSVTAATQVDTWLKAQPALKKKLFQKGSGLEDAAKAVRASKQVASARSPLPSADWKLTPEALGEATSPVKGLPMQWSSGDGAQIWTVRLFAAPDDAKDFCRPRISALLADAKGKPRFAFHGDYGGEATAVVYGDRCEVLTFSLDPESHSFVPVSSKLDGCDPKKK